MQLLSFAKSCPGSAAGFLLYVLLQVYNCLLYTLLGGSLAAFKKSCFCKLLDKGFLNKETTLAFLWMQLLPFAKSCPGSAAGFLLYVLLQVYNCLLYSLLGGSLAAFKKSCFCKLLDKGFLNKETTLAFHWMQLLPFAKSCPGSAAGFLLYVLLQVYNCLLYTLLGGSLAAFKKSCFRKLLDKGFLNKETTLAFHWMQLLPFAKSSPGSAAGFLLYVLLQVYNCLLYSGWGREGFQETFKKIPGKKKGFLIVCPKYGRAIMFHFFWGLGFFFNCFVKGASLQIN